jgi:uncharacterized protein YjiS (DUF1127 family)
LAAKPERRGTGRDKKSNWRVDMKYATSAAFAEAFAEAYEYGNAEISSADTTSNLATRFYMTVNTWRQRSRIRAQLAGISSHSLQDIGISKIDAMIALNKPFWEE